MTSELNLKRDIMVKGVSLSSIMMKKSMNKDKNTPEKMKKKSIEQKKTNSPTPSGSGITKYLIKKKAQSQEHGGEGGVQEDRKHDDNVVIDRKHDRKTTLTSVVKKKVKDIEKNETKLTFVSGRQQLEPRLTTSRS